MANNHALRKRCPRCKKWICGWCAGTPIGASGVGTVPRNQEW